MSGTSVLEKLISSTSTDKEVIEAQEWLWMIATLDPAAGGSNNRLSVEQGQVMEVYPGSTIYLPISPGSNVRVETDSSTPVKWSFAFSPLPFVGELLREAQKMSALLEILICSVGGAMPTQAERGIVSDAAEKAIKDLPSSKVKVKPVKKREARPRSEPRAPIEPMVPAPRPIVSQPRPSQPLSPRAVVPSSPFRDSVITRRPEAPGGDDVRVSARPRFIQTAPSLSPDVTSPRVARRVSVRPVTRASKKFRR